MPPDRSARPRRLPRPLAILLTLAVLAGPALRSTPSLAAPSSDAPPLDLAVMALTPDDLAEDVLYGYGIADGGSLSPEAVAATDLRQAYELRLGLPTEDGNPAQSVRSTIHEYADERGATAAFPIVTGWVGVITAIQVSEDASIGDESTMTRLIGTTTPPYHGLDLTFRSGRIIASVRLIDFTGAIPAVSDATRLAAHLLSRIQTESDDPSAGLAPRTLRIAGEGIIPVRDYYTIAGGRIRQLAYQSTAATAETTVAEAGILAEYEVSQHIVTHGLAEQDTYLYSYVLRFADEEAAAAHLRDSPTRIAGNDPSSNYEEIPGLREYGDDFLAYTQTAHWAANDVDLTYETYLLRVGSFLAQVQLIAPEWVPYGALEDLAAAQADCLGHGFCTEPVPLPAALVAMVQDAAGEDPAQLSPYTGTVPSLSRTYVGPTFGVELTYDPASWTVGADESDDTGDRLILFEEDTPTTLTISAYPAADDAAACIANLTAGFADDEAYGRAIQVTDENGMPVAASAPDLAYAAYGLALGYTTRAFFYVECRTFAGGDLTLLITHTGPLNQYPARAAAREDLLAGLDLPEN